MATQLGYGVSDVVGSPFDFYTSSALQGVTGKLATGQTLQMRNNKIVIVAAATIAALTVTLPQSPVDGATAEISNSVGGFTITALTINPATSYQVGNITQSATVSDVIVGTAVSATSTAAAVTYKYQYSLNGDVTAGAGPRSWIRVQ